MFARVGGDEFCIFLAADDETGASKVAKKVRSVIEDVVVEKMRTEIPQCAEYNGKLSASIGVAALTNIDVATNESIEEVMRKADYASYVVKAAGKQGELTVEQAHQIDEDGRYSKDFLDGKTLPR